METEFETEIESEMRDLRQARDRVKSQLIRFQTFLKTTKYDFIGLEVRLSKIECAFDRFDEIQSRLESLDENEEEQRQDQ